MEPSQDLFTENTEVEILHSPNSETTKIANEKPLSPVLSGTSVKKIINSKKRNNKQRCRAKLIKKFDCPEETVTNVTNKDISEFPEDINESDTLLERFKKLEQIEKHRAIVYDELLSNSVSDNSTFNEPLHPLSHQKNQTKNNPKTTSSTLLSDKKAEFVTTEFKNSLPDCIFEHSFIETPNVIPKVSISVNNGFQKASGEKIVLTEATLQEHSKLFDDILTTRYVDDKRKKKFNYIHKNITNISNSESDSQNPTSIKDNFDKSNLGFKTALDIEQLQSTVSFEKDLEASAGTKPYFCTATPHSLKNTCKDTFGDKDLKPETSTTCDSFIKVSEASKENRDLENLVKIEKPLFSSAKTYQNPHSSKTFFSDANFSDLKPTSNICSGFIKVSESTKLLPNEYKSMVPISEDFHKPQLSKSNVKDIFANEDFSDLKPTSNICIGFKKVSESTKLLPKEYKPMVPVLKDFHTPQPTKSSFKDIFANEDFSDLKPTSNICIGFKKVSESMKLLPKEYKPMVPVLKDFHTPQPTKSSFKDIFANEDFSDLKPMNNICSGLRKPNIDVKCHTNTKDFVGFTKVSETNTIFPNKNKPLVSITADLNTPQQTKKTFKDIFSDEDFSDLKPLSTKHCGGFQKFSLHKPKRTKNVFEGEDFSDLMPLNVDFKTPVARNSNIPSKKNPRNIFEDEDFSDLKAYNSAVSTQPIIEPIKAEPPKIKKESLSFTQELSNSCITDSQMNTLMDEALKAEMLKSECNDLSLLFQVNNDVIDEFKGFSEKEGYLSKIISKFYKSVSTILKEELDKSIKERQIVDIFNITEIKELLRQIQEESCKENTTPQIKRKATEAYEGLSQSKKFKNDLDNTPKRTHSEETLSNQSCTRKRFGTSLSRSIPVSETRLERARKLFDQDLIPQTSTPLRNSCGGIRFNQNYSPIPYNNSSSLRNVSNSSLSESTVIEKTVINVEHRVFFAKNPTKGSFNDWINELENEKQMLNERLRLIDEKQSLLNKQQHLLETNNEIRNKPKLGVLSTSKSGMSNRVCLKEMVNMKSEISSCDNLLFSITPQNAEKLYFEIENKSQACVLTKDGAVIIPNIHGAVGLSEVENAFKVMPNVDPKLIPKNWIKNHFKWIVWKLVSYERRFLDKFESVLNLENVIQQLKYRYDREIDKAERPALRKILEKDDVPQKRMVLCVSNILKIDDAKYELELTDGWYSIRTVIDRPLCDQIVKRKLKLGFKIITYGAELLNCDGCHPLEVTELTRLKINYNSTRRATWDAKLGYQKDSKPFILPIDSFVDNGGNIGCVKFYVARVYPVKYLERIGDTKVWRNKRAEERRLHEWQYNRSKVLEKIQENVETSYNSKSVLVRSSKNISGIQDPKELFEIFSNCKDPETLEESLTESQKRSLQNYQLNRSREQRYEIEKQVKEKVSQLHTRAVTALLKVSIIDILEKNDKQHVLHIWRPSEGHLQIFKEEHILSAYNVSYNKKWGLSTTMKSQFNPEGKCHDEKFLKFQRTVTLINEINQMNNNLEFDTVGLVVQIRIEDLFQQLWLTDSQKNLLLVNVYDCPKNIQLFDNMAPGQVVTGCNLVLSECNDNAVIATANHFTVFARYSKYKHLQQAAEKFSGTLPKDINSFIQTCNETVENIVSKHKSYMRFESHVSGSEDMV